MQSKDAKFFNVSEKHEMDHVCDKYENPDAVRQFILEKAREGVIKYWTHEKLAAFLTENGFKRAPKAASLSMAELARQLQEKCALSQAEARKFLDGFLSCLEETLVAGESVTFQGFGVFKVESRAARKGRNPQTGAEIEIPARKVVKFTPAKALKDSVSGK